MRNVLDFLKWVEGQCAFYGVKLRLDARGRYRNGDLGYFCETDRLLYAVANHPDWTTTLAHEVGHMTQWAEKNKAAWYDEVDLALYEGWLAGSRRPKPPVLKKTVQAIQKHELDAERRALQIIKKFHLTADIEGYAKKANLYVWQFHHTLITGKPWNWNPTEQKSKDLLKLVPPKLIRMSQINKIPTELSQAFIEYCQ